MIVDELELQIFNDLTQLPSVREAVDGFGERNELPVECSFGLKLALCELLANTISYGYEDQGRHSIDISIKLQSGVARFEIVDDGVAFDPTRKPAPSEKHTLKDLPAGGYGVHLAKNFVDTMDYQRKGGRNHLVVTKMIRDL